MRMKSTEYITKNETVSYRGQLILKWCICT